MKEQTPFILASASPRRRQFLEEAGFKFQIIPSSADEDLSSGGDPEALAIELSEAKADEVASRHPDAIVLSADTIVVLETTLGQKILGKPTDKEDARQMLHALSGKAHKVITAFTVKHKEKNLRFSRAVTTSVVFRKLTTEEINEYINTGEPMDKAGAYGIQGKGGALVEQVEGDYNNVVGLPLDAVMEALADFGIKTD